MCRDVKDTAPVNVYYPERFFLATEICIKGGSEVHMSIEYEIQTKNAVWNMFIIELDRFAEPLESDQVPNLRPSIETGRIARSEILDLMTTLISNLDCSKICTVGARVIYE